MKLQCSSMKTPCCSRAIGTALSQRRSFFDYRWRVCTDLHVCLRKGQDRRQKAVQRSSWGDWKYDQERKWRELEAIGGTYGAVRKSGFQRFILLCIRNQPETFLFYFFPVSARLLPKTYIAWFLSLPEAPHQTFTVPCLAQAKFINEGVFPQQPDSNGVHRNVALTPALNRSVTARWGGVCWTSADLTEEVGLVAQFLTPSPPGELSPPVPPLGPSYSKVIWKPLQTGGESLCTCGIKQKSKQIARREQAYSAALKMNALNVRDCREICPIPVDPRGLASSPRQTLHGGRCQRAVGCWFVFCKYGERGWERCWAPAFALGAADAPDQSMEGYWGSWAGLWGGGSLGRWWQLLLPRT